MLSLTEGKHWLFYGIYVYTVDPIAYWTQTWSACVPEVLLFYVLVSLLTSTPLKRAATLVLVTNGAIYRTVMFAIDNSPHRIPDTFLKKRSPSLITVLCPTLVCLTLFFLSSVQLWSCGRKYNWKIKALLSGQSFWWSLKIKAQEG